MVLENCPLAQARGTDSSLSAVPHILCANTTTAAFENSVWMPVLIKTSFRELKQSPLYTFTQITPLKKCVTHILRGKKQRAITINSRITAMSKRQWISETSIRIIQRHSEHKKHRALQCDLFKHSTAFLRKALRYEQSLHLKLFVKSILEACFLFAGTSFHFYGALHSPEQLPGSENGRT